MSKTIKMTYNKPPVQQGFLLSKDDHFASTFE